VVPAEKTPKQARSSSEVTSTTAPQVESQLVFRPLVEQQARRSLSDASTILKSTMEVIDFRDEDLQDVLRLIATKSRLNIIMRPEGVQGKVTLHLENVRLGVALENILRSNDLAYVISGDENIVRIVDAKSVGLEKVETKTEIIQLNWVDAVKLGKTLSELFQGDTKIVPNQETNSLIVTTTPPTLETIRDLIAKADIAERQVLIEARLVDLTIDASRMLGSSLSAWRRDSSRNSPVTRTFIDKVSGRTSTEVETITDKISEIIGPIDPLSPPSVTPPTRDITRTVTNTVGPDTESAVEAAADIMQSTFPVTTGGKGFNWAFGEVVSIFGKSFNIAAQIQALEEMKLVEILANPRVVTLSNIPAKISIIERIPYTESVTGVSGATTMAVEFEDAGVEISVTPIITANGFVRMNLTTSQKIFRGRVGDGALDPPLIDHRDANTNVIVKGGDTVMIGGLRELRAAESSSSVPWFGDIPVLGWLFKNKQNGDTKTELVLFVTPSIIEKPILTTGEKAWYDRIDTKWHLPDYFFDDVKTKFDK